jgi:hypothetical protein
MLEGIQWVTGLKNRNRTYGALEGRKFLLLHLKVRLYLLSSFRARIFQPLHSVYGNVMA